MPNGRPGRASERGLTLIELMVAVAMVAILVAVAVPYFNRDQAKNDFETVINSLAQDLQAARFQAISDRTLRDIELFPIGTPYYRLVVPAVAPVVVPALLHQGRILSNIEISGYRNTLPIDAAGGPTNVGNVSIRFSMIGDLQICNPVCASGPIAIYVRSTDNRYRARIIVARANGYARRLEGW